MGQRESCPAGNVPTRFPCLKLKPSRGNVCCLERSLSMGRASSNTGTTSTTVENGCIRMTRISSSVRLCFLTSTHVSRLRNRLVSSEVICLHIMRHLEPHIQQYLLYVRFTVQGEQHELMYPHLEISRSPYPEVVIICLDKMMALGLSSVARA